jgi:hypothetical protein
MSPDNRAFPDTDALSDIETILTNTATTIQKTARLKLSWPKNTQIKTFKPKSGLRPQIRDTMS